MPNTLLWPLKNINEEVAIALGVSGVEVELTEQDIERAVRTALRLYNRSRPGQRKTAITLSANQKKYLLDPATDEFKGIQGVLTVEHVRSRITDGIDPFDPLSVIGPGGIHTGIDTFADYDQKLQYIEQARRIASSEFEWTFQWEPDPADSNILKPYLYADIPATLPADTSLLYSFHYRPDGSEITGLQNIPDGDTDWFIDYVTAFAKTILGRIRGKFKGIPGPDGSDLSVDYDDLMTEGREDLKELTEEIKKRRRPLPPEIE